MKKKLLLSLISSLAISSAVYADLDLSSEPIDYTGEAIFTIPTAPSIANTSDTEEHNSKSATPPVKLLRLMIKDKLNERAQKKFELAPTQDGTYAGEIETSDYASKDIAEDFDSMSPDGFDADEEAIAENEKTKRGFFKKKSNKNESYFNNEDIILDCEKVDYDTVKYLVFARGNVSVEFVKQATTVKADIITFDRMNNTIKAEGNVRILKHGQTITGDYIFVDMNEENALIENPVTNMSSIEIRSQKGYVYGDRIVQEKGQISVEGSYPIKFKTANYGPRTSDMLVTADNDFYDNENNSDKVFKFTAKDIKIKQKGDLEVISLKRPRLYKNEKTIFKVPALKVYTNKTHDYVESNIWEIGSYRGLGIYTGPGWVFELPKGSVLKAIPMLNYKSGLGVGGLGRFSSGTNQTMLAYGTAAGKIMAYGKQNLDDNLYLQYGMNSYQNEWFLGRRRPKYGASLVYQKGYSSQDFLLKGQVSQYEHRLDAGYYQDLNFDHSYEGLSGHDMGTGRFRYMAEARQTFLNYGDKEKLKAFVLGANTQFSSAIYGNGATQVIGRLGPYVHVQYKRWMQDAGYYFSVYDDNTPMPVFDAYRYGKQNFYLREYIKLNKYLTICWFGSMNLSNDSPNDKTLQENAFYLSIGDEVRFNIGYDFIRQNMRCTIDMNMDAKGATVEYDSLEIKQEKKAKNAAMNKKTSEYQAPSVPKVLERAEVEDIRILEDVI